MSSELDGKQMRTWSRSDLLIGVGLYLVALIAILIEIGNRPAFAYNWENYTLWDGFPWWDAPSLNAFDLTDGLMTDSGRSWWVLGPTWLAFRIADTGLTPLRIATGAVAALSVPLTWILARSLITGMFTMPGWSNVEQATLTRAARWAAALSGLLLVALASWLLYARTATLVGLSVAPALLTIIIIDQLRRLTDAWWVWLIALQTMLLLDAWAYAPIRFLYPFALVYFGVELLFRRQAWRRWLVVIGVTAVSLPLLLATVDQDPAWRPIESINDYYNARGEQILALRENPNDFAYFLRDVDMEQSPDELERQLIEQNARDLVRLFFDIDTRPAITDYWNQTGRLMPWFLAPFVLLGMAVSLLRVVRAPESRLLHLMFWGFTLPMILTSKVHIGRLVFAMPFLCIFAAIGIIGIAWGLTFHFDRRTSRRPLINLAAPLLALALLIPVAASAFADYRTPVTGGWETRFADLLESNPEQFQNGVAWIGGDLSQLTIEEISLAAVRIEVDHDYQFVNLAAGETPDRDDPRPVVYFGAVPEFLDDPSTATALCALPWAMRDGAEPFADLPPACQSDTIIPIS